MAGLVDILKHVSLFLGHISSCVEGDPYSEFEIQQTSVLIILKLFSGSSLTSRNCLLPNRS